MTPAPARPALDVVVPVFNEERVLAQNIAILAAYLERELPLAWRITIADNGSTDLTAEVADELAKSLPRVEVKRIGHRGRGGALHDVWLGSDARVLAYMDIDLSTNLESLLPLAAPILSGHSELAIGTRLARQAHVRRKPGREVLSRGYNLLVRVLLGARFSDAQCGFKAIRADIAERLLPLVEDRDWFFDTELLLLAERNGMNIFEVPVDWIEDLDSRVDIPSTALDDLKGLWRMRRRFWRGEGRLQPISPDEASLTPEADESTEAVPVR
jgi:glycosyltransferase involved in cell wall biosynthesis